VINRGQEPGDSVIYGEGGDQHIWMVAAPEGNLTLKPIQYSSSSFPTTDNCDGFGHVNHCYDYKDDELDSWCSFVRQLCVKFKGTAS